MRNPIMEDAVGRGTFPQVSPIPILLLENNPGEVLRFKQILSADKRREVFTIVHLSRLEIAANYLAGRPEGPMVIITSLFLPDSRGLEIVRRLRESGPDSVVVALYQIRDRAVMGSLLAAGADLCLDRDPLARDFEQTIRHLIGHSAQSEG